MPHYVTLLRYTPQGAAKIKESPQDCRFVTGRTRVF